MHIKHSCRVMKEHVMLLCIGIHLFSTNYRQSAWNSVKVQPISTFLPRDSEKG